MSEVMCAAPLQRSSDFFLYEGQWIDGACPATALANTASSALGRSITPISVYLLMREHGLCDPNGAATIGDIQQAAILLGCEIAAYRGYGEPWTDWEAWMIEQAQAGNPAVIESAYGQALKDSVTGLGENYVGSLDYHFFGSEGYLSGGTSPYAEKTFNKLVTGPGFWCPDGDNWAGNNGIAWQFNCTKQLQFYPSTIIEAARPCAALALKGRSTVMAWSTETDGSGKDSAGHVCSAGFMKAMAESPTDLESDGLAGSIGLPNATAFLALENGTVIVADPPTAPFKRFAGEGLAQEWMKLYDLYQKAASTPPSPAPIPTQYVRALAAVEALSAAQAVLNPTA